MNNQAEDRFNYIGRILFMVFFIGIAFAHIDHSERPINYTTQFELLTQLHADSGHAVCVESLQTVCFQKSLVSFLDRTGFAFFNANFKIASDNNKTNQRILLIQKIQQLFKPTSTCRFYYHLFSIVDKEPPLLS